MSAADTDRALIQAFALGRQATLEALESMLGPSALRLGAPQVAPAEFRAHAPAAQAGWVVSVPLQRGGHGAWALALEEKHAQTVVVRLLRRAFTEWDDLAQSALMELGNVGACAFLGGVAQHARAPLVPGVPTARSGDLAAGLQRLAQPLQVPRAAWAACDAAAAGRDWHATVWLILEQAEPQTFRLGDP